MKWVSVLYQKLSPFTISTLAWFRWLDVSYTSERQSTKTNEICTQILSFASIVSVFDRLLPTPLIHKQIIESHGKGTCELILLSFGNLPYLILPVFLSRHWQKKNWNICCLFLVQKSQLSILTNCPGLSDLCSITERIIRKKRTT